MPMPKPKRAKPATITWPDARKMAEEMPIDMLQMINTVMLDRLTTELYELKTAKDAGK